MYKALQKMAKYWFGFEPDSTGPNDSGKNSNPWNSEKKFQKFAPGRDEIYSPEIVS